MEAFRGISSFSPVAGFGKTGKTILAPTSFAEKIPFYLLPENTAEANRITFSRYLAYCGTASGGLLPVWKTWVVTWTCLVTPAFASRLPPSSYRKVDVTSQQMTALSTLMGNLQAAMDTENRPGVEVASGALRESLDFPLLPRIHPDVDLALGNGEWVGKVVLCYYSIILFLAGKRIEGEDHSQITDLRPKALRGKAHIDAPLDFLEGSLRMSDASHLFINNAWSEMGQLRTVVFTEYAGYDSDDTDLAKDIIWTSVHLLRFAYMSHALITYNFLQAYPWAYDVPALKTSISIYISSLKESGKVDQRLFPFIKLIYGDKSGLFPRKEMEPLIACAKKVQEESNSSLADFYSNASFNPIVEAFMEEKERREKIRGMGLEKKEKELLDYFGEDEISGDSILPTGAPMED